MKTKKQNEETNNNKLIVSLFSIIILILLLATILGWGFYFYQKRKSFREQEIFLNNELNKRFQGSRMFQNNLNINQNDNLQNQNSNIQTSLPSTNFLENSEMQTNLNNSEELGITESMGFIKKIYSKSGKNYLDIDYIQWLTEEEAQKAMREDGVCPKKGECIVYNDYYIRNQNPLIRTFEISSDVKVFMQTLDMEKYSIRWNYPITFEKLKDIFATKDERLRSAPYIIKINNKKVIEIREQYTP